VTETNEDIIGIEGAIAALRKNPTKGAQQAADELEVKLYRMKHKIGVRIDALSIERLGEWADELRADLVAAGWPHAAIDTWKNQRLVEDALQALEIAWCATAFRVRETAKMLGFDGSVINAWLDSESWRGFALDKNRRATQVATLADMAVSRLANILAIDTNDIELLRLQERAAHDVLTAGLRLPGLVPNPGGKRSGLPASHGRALEQSAGDKVPAAAGEKRKRSVR
jgi:hypothetical protein